jgi:BirA family transcriptional regulator, biotin operon repressor / biotin---[acetyl-CoA-carboxylase] ligase
MTADGAGWARLAGTRWGPVVQLAETTSTNVVLLKEALAGAPEGLVAVADHQTAGRGRFDRRWDSPPGASLLFSVLVRPPARELPAGRRHLAVAAVSLAVVEAARVVAGVELALKWPNDLVVSSGPLLDRKVAGVLAETAEATTTATATATAPDSGPAGSGPAIVIGVGLNVKWAPPGPAATSLEVVAARPVDRDELLVETMLALDQLYGHWDGVSRRYRQASATVGRDVTVSFAPNAAHGGPPVLHGTALDIDDDGLLVVRTGAGERVKVAAGDVTHATMARSV